MTTSFTKSDSAGEASQAESVPTSSEHEVISCGVVSGDAQVLEKSPSKAEPIPTSLPLVDSCGVDYQVLEKSPDQAEPGISSPPRADSCGVDSGGPPKLGDTSHHGKIEPSTSSGDGIPSIDVGKPPQRISRQERRRREREQRKMMRKREFCAMLVCEY